MTAQSLHEWYLAKLRIAAQKKQAESNVTPRRFVEADRALLQAMITSAGSDRRSVDFDQICSNQRDRLFLWQFIKILGLLTTAGTLLLVFFSFLSF